jgi:hypothetical protein
MSAVATWPGRAESWLDERGRGAWIAAMVLGFILFWPVGLAILAYMIWGKQMFGKSCKTRGMGAHPSVQRHSSGNRAFDAYKAETLKRLEDEQAAFEGFMEQLRKAKDKAEFDAFMDERRRRSDVPARTEDANA